MRVKDLTRKPPQKAAKSAPVEWEHKQVSVLDGADLQSHAAGGWELVSVVRSMRPDYVIAYFKRRK